jgi:hypothetical protein
MQEGAIAIGGGGSSGQQRLGPAGVLPPYCACWVHWQRLGRMGQDALPAAGMHRGVGYGCASVLQQWHRLLWLLVMRGCIHCSCCEYQDRQAGCCWHAAAQCAVAVCIFKVHLQVQLGVFRRPC